MANRERLKLINKPMTFHNLWDRAKPDLLNGKSVALNVYIQKV